MLSVQFNYTYFKDISDGELMLVRYDKDLFFILDTNLKYTDFENRINNLIAAAIPEHILFKSNKIPLRFQQPVLILLMKILILKMN